MVSYSRRLEFSCKCCTEISLRRWHCKLNWVTQVASRFWFILYNNKCRSQWPHGLRHRSAAARLLRPWVRISPEAWILSVMSVVCCQVEVCAMSWSLVQRSPTNCGCVIVYDPETSRMREAMTALGRSATWGGIIIIIIIIIIMC
jgi:hypothetical protein